MGRIFLLWVLIISVACSPKRPERVAIGVSGPPPIIKLPKRPEPPTKPPIETPEPVWNPTQLTPPTHTPPGVSPHPQLEPPEPAPRPWARHLFNSFSTRVIRRVVASESIVGIGHTADGIWAIGAKGGIFRSVGVGPVTPQPTPLPAKILWAEDLSNGLLVCPAEGMALFSVDGGQRFAHLGFPCGHEGRRTVAQGLQTLALLPNGILRIGELPRGRFVEHMLPLPQPSVIGAAGQSAVIFGVGEVLWSKDAGQTFHAGVLPTNAPAIRDIAILAKGLIIAVGEAQNGGPSMLISRNGGVRWHAPPRLPRGAESLARVAVNQAGQIVATPDHPSGTAIWSDDGGRSFLALDDREPVTGAVYGNGSGFLLGASRGILRSLNGPTHRVLGIDRPLWDTVFIHPRRGFGIGSDGGLYRTHGHARWSLIQGTQSVRFWSIAADDFGRLWVVGDGLFWRSSDQGQSWDQSDPPDSCQARWVTPRHDGVYIVAGCADGGIVVSNDAGVHWKRATDLVEPTSRAVWLDEYRLAALGRSGRVLYLSEDRGNLWSPLVVPSLDPGVHLAHSEAGLSLLTDAGRVGTTTDPRAEWRWQPTGVNRVVAHQGLSNGRLLILTDTALWTVDELGAHPIALAPAARGLTLTGDGGAILLQDGATTRLIGR